MLFFAWSLLLSAVKNARRRKLLTILRSYMLSPLVLRSALVCRLCHRSPNRLKHAGYANLVGQPQRLSKTPSEPTLTSTSNNTYETVLYRTENVEILSAPSLNFRIDEWIPAFRNRNQLLITNKDERVFFTIKTLPILHPIDKPSTSNLLNLETDEQESNNHYLIDNLANRIACKKNSYEEMFYETTMNNFYMIVVYWSEGSLQAFRGGFEISEINSIRPGDLELIRNAIEDHTSSTSSLAVYSSFASLNVDREIKPYTGCRSSKCKVGTTFQDRTLSLLELLYEQERGVNVWNITNVYNNIFIPRNDLFDSDTALDERSSLSEQHGSFIRRSHKRLSDRTFDSHTRYRSCSPSACYSLKHRAPTGKRSVPSVSRFSSPPSIPVYIQRRRKHCDSFSSDASAAIVPPLEISRSSTFSSEEIKDLSKFDEDIDHVKDFEHNETVESTGNTELIPEDNKGCIKQTDSPRDRILPLHSTFLNLCHRPLARLSGLNFNRSRPPQTKMDKEFLEDGNLPRSENHLYIVPVENFNPRRRHSLTPESLFNSPECLGVQVENDFTVNDFDVMPMGMNALAFAEHSMCENEQIIWANSYRRRSLTPLSLSLLANYGSKEAIDSISSLQIGFQTTDSVFRHCIVTPRRRSHSMSSNGIDIKNNNNGAHISAHNGACRSDNKPRTKPPTILVYTGDKREQFDSIARSLQQILPRDTYTLSHLSTTALRLHPWVDYAACLLISDTQLLDDLAWVKLQSYFVYSGKILFVCQNSLVANLTHCDSVKKQVNMIKSAFGKKASSGALGKDFESFLTKSLKKLNKCKEVNETFHAKDPIGGYKFSVVFHKKTDQPLFLYMENSEHQANALFSDATTEQLLSTSGQQLIAEAMSRLGIQIKHNDPLPRLTRGYLICQKDQIVLEMDGLVYGDEMGDAPRFVFRPTIQLEGESLPNAEHSLLPIEIRRRKTGIPSDTFDIERYFEHLQTKSLGRVFLHVPVCDTTINICKSLNRVFPNFDGIVVSADIQRMAVGRGGNQWLSPKGSISFSFDFNVPIDSDLGKNIVFLQHILAVSIVDAVLSLLKIPDFPLRIKWPNDIYYGRSYKVGGILVSASSDSSFMRCIISSGLNVTNSNPTVCINDMLPADFERPLTVEKTLAEIMNKFEYHVNVFVNHGKKEFLESYESLWLHSREEVTVIHEESGLKDKVVIRGLDPNGYLEVRSKNSGKVFSVFDDSNTFDLLKGLIRPK